MKKQATEFVTFQQSASVQTQRISFQVGNNTAPPVFYFYCSLCFLILKERNDKCVSWREFRSDATDFYVWIFYCLDIPFPWSSLFFLFLYWFETVSGSAVLCLWWPFVMRFIFNQNQKVKRIPTTKYPNDCVYITMMITTNDQLNCNFLLKTINVRMKKYDWWSEYFSCVQRRRDYYCPI